MNHNLNDPCPFCNLEPDREIIIESAASFAVFDRLPVSKGHALIILKRHCTNYFELTIEEQTSCWRMVNNVQQTLKKRYNPDGFNIVINVYSAAGQTVPHVHIHLIPRYLGDESQPEGGFRGVVYDRRVKRKE
jgi:ATP adenylyltransferase